MHGHSVRIVGARRSNDGRAWTAGVDRRHHSGIEEIIERRLDRLGGGVLFGDSSHDRLLHSAARRYVALLLLSQNRGRRRATQPRSPSIASLQCPSHEAPVSLWRSRSPPYNPAQDAPASRSAAAREDTMTRFCWVLLSAFCIALTATDASAQAGYPNKAIRILVPYAPGGLTDVVARHYAEQLRKDLGQNVVIENKP